MAGTDESRRVWDLPVRIVHWLLVAALVGAYATHKAGVAYFEYHAWCGYTVVVLSAFRILWGFFGTRHARFASFVRGPRATARYARQVVGGRAPRHVGHNPLGGAMVIALFICVAALALTGWLYTTDRFFGDEVVEIVHETLAWTLVALAALHVGGVVFASRHQRENLIAAMFDGRKRAPRDDDIA